MNKICCVAYTVIVIMCISSCSSRETYKAEYPEFFTPEYCYQNYVDADPNLTYLICARNGIGRHEENRHVDRYYAIKDIPVDKYLCSFRNSIMFSKYLDAQILKHKDLHEEAILDYAVTELEIYWGWLDSFEHERDMYNIGNDKVCESLVSTDAKDFQEYLCSTVELIVNNEFYEGISSLPPITKQYTQDGVASELVLQLRVYFTEYDNLVWDAQLCCDETKSYGAYFYLRFNLPTYFDESYSYGYREVYIPLPENIASLIPSE